MAVPEAELTRYLWIVLEIQVNNWMQWDFLFPDQIDTHSQHATAISEHMMTISAMNNI